MGKRDNLSESPHIPQGIRRTLFLHDTNAHQKSDLPFYKYIHIFIMYNMKK